jgi:hypothetical protein
MPVSPARRGDRAVLEDATGRRGRWMRRLGRVTTLLVFGWLAVLVLGGLGLAPVADLPFAEALRPSNGPEPLAAAPKPRRPTSDDLRPALPAATARVTTTPAETVAASTPARAPRPAQSRSSVRRFVPKARGRARRVTRQTISTPARVRPAPLTVTTTTAPPGQTRTAPRGQSAQAPGHSGDPAPGQSTSPPGQAATSPGRSATAPGQATKTTETVTTPTPAPKGPQKP